HRHAAAHAARGRGRRARPRRGLRLRLLRAPRPRGAGAPGGDPIPVLIYRAPELSATLFHQIPAGIGDPFLYLERDGRRAATVSMLDAHKVPEDIEVIDGATLGRDDLIGSGLGMLEIEAEVSLRALQRVGITEAAVPPDFPLFLADHFRAGG